MSAQSDKCIDKIYQAKKIAIAKGHKDALPLFHEITRGLPDHHGALTEFADLANILGEYTLATGALVKACELDPQNAATIANLGATLLSNRQFELAETQLLKAIELEPELWTANKDLGALYATLKRYRDGIPYLKRAVELKPSNPEIHANLAACLLKSQEYDEAILHAEKSIKLNPSDESGYNTIGNALLEMGKIDEAANCFLKVIKIHRHSGAGYSNLTLAKKFSDSDRSFIKKTEALLNESMSVYDRTYILFALCKMHADLKEHEKAFNYARQANLLAASTREENPPPKNYFKSMKKVFTPKFFDTCKELGNPSKKPVFIVGMPRSGTSLTEQIISSHPLAAGAGELDDIHFLANGIANIGDPKQYREGIDTLLNKNAISQLSTQYLESLCHGRESAERITDKMPENYFHLGVILLLFPNAKVIHVIRNPLDTCLSCYFQPFPNLDWSFDANWMANRYKFYRKLMDFWHNVLPAGTILDQKYEDIIASPESSAKRIIEFCGLEWDPACLEFYKTKRAVNTASVWQVRQPIYQSSVKRWRQYGPAIRDLATPLGPYLEQDDLDALRNIGIKIKKGLFA